MSLTRRNLLDVNVLIALTEPGHKRYRAAHEWLSFHGKDNWGVCPLTEAGFLRVTTNSAFRPGPRTLEQAIAILQVIKGYPGYRYWEINESWVSLTARFSARIIGHQQVTDAYLLGLAIKEDGVLVTFDRGLKYMAGPEFSRNLQVLG
jgi:toxin-antitoxin system PIN domain toxin